MLVYNFHNYQIIIFLKYWLRLDSKKMKGIIGEHMYTNKSKSTGSALTKKQENFLSFLKEYLQERGYPPTIRELMDGLGFSSPSIVKKYLDTLERKGYIRRKYNSPRAIEVVEVSGKKPEVRDFPIVGKVNAGAPYPAIEDIEGHFSIDKTICCNNNAFFLRVVGDSMIEAHIIEGDLILVVPQPVANNGEIVVALVNNEATIKRFYKKGDVIQLKPEHPTMKPIFIQGESNMVSIIGRVVAAVRQL